MNLLYPTSVQCETSFSFMNNIKSASRNQLGDETLDHILRIKFSNVEDVHAVVKDIAKKTEHHNQSYN